jgi:predicted house-cleaning NTP pyrophosphatase (Maf/HAM1 superfamily)
MLGALISKGIKATNEKAKAPTPEEIAAQAASNPEVMRILAAKNAQAVADKNKGLPPLSASSGMSNAPATVAKKPTNFKEAYEMSNNAYKAK